MTTITHTPTRPGTMPHCTTRSSSRSPPSSDRPWRPLQRPTDRDGTSVGPSFELLRERGLLTLAVPAELGGWGASVRDVTMVRLRELAHHCASTALASAMHQHVVAFTAWRYRRGMPGAEATLRRVVDDGIVLVSTGGADFTHPAWRGAPPGRRRLSDVGPQDLRQPVASRRRDVDDVRLRRPRAGLASAQRRDPVRRPGCDRLRQLGRARHARHRQQRRDHRGRVRARREGDGRPPPRRRRPGRRCRPSAGIAIPVILGVYVGVAESAATAAIEAAGARSGDPLVQRQVGAMWTRMRQAVWALDAALDATGDDPVPAMETVAEVMAAKRAITDAAFEVCGLAVEIGGGAAFARGSVIERAFRDIRGITFHPFKPEQILLHAGRVALGQPADCSGSVQVDDRAESGEAVQPLVEDDAVRRFLGRDSVDAHLPGEGAGDDRGSSRTRCRSSWPSRSRTSSAADRRPPCRPCRRSWTRCRRPGHTPAPTAPSW